MILLSFIMPIEGEGIGPIPGKQKEPVRERLGGRFDIGNFLVDFAASTKWTAESVDDDDNSHRDENGRRTRFMYDDGVNQLGIGLGLGENEFAFEERLQAEHRVKYIELSRTTYDNAEVFTLDAAHYLHPYTPQIDVFSSKDWKPQPGFDVRYGQNFDFIDTTNVRPNLHEDYFAEYAPLIGEEKVALALEESSDQYEIMTASFLPHYGSAQEYGGGSINMVYFWDRKDGQLTLESVNTTHLRERGEERNYILPKDWDWTRTDGEDRKEVIKPFGVFHIPGKLDELTWFQNVMFPPTYAWSNPRIGGAPKANRYSYKSISANYGASGFNIFNIQQVDTWKEFAGI